MARPTQVVQRGQGAVTADAVPGGAGVFTAEALRVQGGLCRLGSAGPQWAESAGGGAAQNAAGGVSVVKGRRGLGPGESGGRAAARADAPGGAGGGLTNRIASYAVRYEAVGRSYTI